MKQDISICRIFCGFIGLSYSLTLHLQQFPIFIIQPMKQQQSTLKVKKIKKEPKEETEQLPIKTKTIKKQPKQAVQSPAAKLSTNIHQLPTIQNVLQIPQQQRLSKCKQYFEQVRPFLSAFMQKKVGSRVLQLIFKWGDTNVRNLIHQCILQNWKDLIKSKYSLYLIEKVSKNLELPGVPQDVMLLQGSWEGAYIVENYISTRGEQGLRKIKDKFYMLWEQNKSGDIKAQQTLHNLSLKSIEKQFDNLHISKFILRLSVSSMFAEEKQKVLDYLVEKVALWTNDDEGVRLFIEVVNASDNKQKKQIIRAYKGHILEIAQQHSACYVTIIKLLSEVDDTVFLQKTILTEVQELFPHMATDKHAYSIVFSLFAPRTNNFNVLGKYQHAVTHTECKKSEEVRKAELRAHLYSPLLAFLDGENLYHILRHHLNNKLIVAIYKSLQEDNKNELFNDFVRKIAKHYLDDAKDNLKGGNFNLALTADPNANKIIKNVLLLPDAVVDYYCDQFAKLAVANLSSFLNTKASYILLGLIEKGGREHLLNEVKRSRLKLQDVVAGQLYMNLLKSK